MFHVSRLRLDDAMDSGKTAAGRGGDSASGRIGEWENGRKGEEKRIAVTDAVAGRNDEVAKKFHVDRR